MKYPRLAPCVRVQAGLISKYFFNLQLWPLIFLQPLDQNQSLVLHLKDLFHICLEPKAQGFWMTFNLCNCGSKYPYFNRAYIVSGGFGCPYLYILIVSTSLYLTTFLYIVPIARLSFKIYEILLRCANMPLFFNKAHKIDAEWTFFLLGGPYHQSLHSWTEMGPFQMHLILREQMLPLPFYYQSQNHL